MAKIPLVSGREAVKAFARAGWVWGRTAGSHAILTKPGTRNVLSVPLHGELGRGLLRHLIRVAGITVEGFRRLLEGRPP